MPLQRQPRASPHSSRKSWRQARCRAPWQALRPALRRRSAMAANFLSLPVLAGASVEALRGRSARMAVRLRPPVRRGLEPIRQTVPARA